MNGTITFPDAEQLGIFLKAFEGSTAVYNVERSTNGSYILTFNGGY